MEVLFEGGANSQQGNWQCFQPVSHCLANEGCLELVVEPFYQTVGTGVIGSGSDTRDAEEFLRCSQRWEVREDGTPNPAIQPNRNAWVTVSVVVVLSIMTSGQRVKRSTQMSR